MRDNKIVIKGAKEHNLKNIDLELERDQLVVFTGLSGSGKSSLAFDTSTVKGTLHNFNNSCLLGDALAKIKFLFILSPSSLIISNLKNKTPIISHTSTEVKACKRTQNYIPYYQPVVLVLNSLRTY